MKKNSVLSRNLKHAADTLLRADRILIACHIDPDGDTIGSLLALGLSLLMLDKKVVMVSPDGMPQRYQFLPGASLVQTQLRGKVDVAVAVDCGSIRQLGPLRRVFKATKTTFQIDHHDFAEDFCKHLVADPDAAAVGEIIYDLIKILGVQITPVIATGLLTSIIVDTGSFRFSNIRSRTFRICADLLDKGVDLKYLIEEAYWKKSETTVRLEAFCLQHMNFERHGKVVWSYVRQRDFKELGGEIADADGVCDDLRAIEGVKASCVFRESEKGMCRVSLRAAPGINVAKVAQVFGGGGHFHSAGCMMKNNKTNRDKLIKILCSIVS